MVADGIFYLEGEWAAEREGKVAKTVRLDKKETVSKQQVRSQISCEQGRKEARREHGQASCSHDLSFEENGSSFKLLD